jgi:hypothetical protein
MPAKKTPKRKPKVEPPPEPNVPHITGKSLADVVGPYVYESWVLMLRALVPEGRTHRLGPLVAAMLQYAAVAASEADAEALAENPVAAALIASADAFEPDEVEFLLGNVVKRLFKDAGVEYQRQSKRGQDYTILDTAYEEYLHWFDMPWD